MAQKHILVVSQYFYPEQFRINDMCREWVKKGYRITVLTGIPNYPQGKFYKGYGWFKRRHEVVDGMEIIRIPLLARGHSAVGLIFNYFSFVISGWFWKIFTHLKADRVFIFEVSPMTQALVGIWYAKRRKIPCDLYVQDLWPENVEIITGVHNRVVLGLIGRMVDYIYKRCTVIFAASPSFVQKIQQRLGKGKEKVLFLPQYAEDFYCPSSVKSQLVPDDARFKVAFTGNIGQAQGLDILPRTAGLLRERGRDVLFVIVGDGRYKDKLQAEVIEHGVETEMLFINRQSPEEIPAILASCDAAFISFMNNELFNGTIPAKLQSYMACGMPIVAAAQGETRRIVEEAECGVCCSIGDSQALADAVERLMDGDDLMRLSENALAYSRVHFDKDNILNTVSAVWSGVEWEEVSTEEID